MGLGVGGGVMSGRSDNLLSRMDAHSVRFRDVTNIVATWRGGVEAYYRCCFFFSFLDILISNYHAIQT